MQQRDDSTSLSFPRFCCIFGIKYTGTGFQLPKIKQLSVSSCHPVLSLPAPAPSDLQRITTASLKAGCADFDAEALMLSIQLSFTVASMITSFKDVHDSSKSTNTVRNGCTHSCPRVCFRSKNTSQRQNNTVAYAPTS